MTDGPSWNLCGSGHFSSDRGCIGRSANMAGIVIVSKKCGFYKVVDCLVCLFVIAFSVFVFHTFQVCK